MTEYFTGHQAFDKQTNLIGGKGNVIAKTFLKWHVDTSNFDEEFKKFIPNLVPHNIELIIRKVLSKYKSIYICVLFHMYKPVMSRSDQRMVHGWVLTTEDDEIISWYVNPKSPKGGQVVFNSLPHIGKPIWR